MRTHLNPPESQDRPRPDGSDIRIRRYVLPQDECYAEEHLLGAAVWMPPNTWQMGPFAQLLMLPAMARPLGTDLPRLLKLSTFTEQGVSMKEGAVSSMRWRRCGCCANEARH